MKGLTCHSAVFSGGVDEEISIGRDGDIRKSPFGEIGGIISEMVSVDRSRRAGVVDFDPISGEAVFVVE